MDFLLIEEVGMKNKINCEMRRVLTRLPLTIGVLLLLALPALAQEDGAVCLDCHDDIAEGLIGTKHELTTGTTQGMHVSCIGCHTDYEQHLDDPTEYHPTRPDTLGFLAQAKICGTCHVTPHQATMVTTDPHSRSQVDCLSCHKIHDNMHEFLLVRDKDEFCTGCHTNVKAQFSQRSSHPLESGNIECLDCHSQDSRKDHQMATGFDWSCQECHTELAGPYLFEHPVTYSHLVDGGGCVECHSPHGSPNESLLNQPGSGICMQCHGIPAGHLTAHSDMATKVDCVNCHTDIHGSNDNSLFLDPMLGTTFYANCYQSGCHGDVR